MKTTLRIALWMAAAACLAPPVLAKPAAPTPAVATVQKFIDARTGGRPHEAFALLSPATQAQLPVNQWEQIAKVFATPSALKDTPPAFLAVIALFADFRNALHFKFRVLGLSPDDPGVVLVRAYQVGTPWTSIKDIKIATVPNPAGGMPLLDFEKTTDRLSKLEMMPPPQGDARQISSQSNMKQIALALEQYLQDHDEHYPDADKWVDEIMPYLRTETVFRDPSAPPGEKWSYAFNRNLSGVKEEQLDQPPTTILLFESAAGTKNASDTGESIPKPGRHHGHTDYALADGHVKSVRDGLDPAAFHSQFSFALDGK